ncbi:hypothetical protein SO802_003203 [Lithocarpus litseifolius]|uniref:Glutaredoxin domain-containing protein n=1 Tax=Lithocarpus litseifolius TaxID=425828 RepID=A0AAW2E382_9ROSI
MGCVSSNLLNHDEEFNQLGSSSLSQHIVSLTSTTYGLLTLDPPPQNSNPTTPPPPTTPPTRFTLSEPKSLWSEPRSLWSEPKFQPADVINSWELMAGLDNLNNSESFRFFKNLNSNKENSNPNKPNTNSNDNVFVLDKLEKLCPPNGENKVVLYTTTLRGVRKTFEQCNAVRAVLQSLGVLFTERDISMDRGFREELRELMKGKEMVPPRVFVKGRYVGGCDEVLKMVEEGLVGEIFNGLPKKRGGFGVGGVSSVCEGCGDVRFLPCFRCSGSCKMVMVVKEEVGRRVERTVVVRCPDCNENGLVLCPICS